MIAEIKKELIAQPEKLRAVLEYFDYCNIVIHSSYISFGRDSESSKKSIVIRLENNPYCYVTDYPRNISQEIFKYICEQRKVDFVTVLNVIKKELNITDSYSYFHKEKGIFGGIYDNIKSKRGYNVKSIDENILKQFKRCANKRFLKDHISICAQRYFQVGYDTDSQAITIPIRNQVGELIGVKARCNYDVEDGEQKYYYLYPAKMSCTLFGYCQNYKYLVNNTILVFESEKSVMQCFSYGIRNCVALGSGTISSQQVKMLLELQPKEIIFMHDVGFELDGIMRNINTVKSYSRFSELQLGYWNYFDKNYKNKVSPSDMGERVLNKILNNEIKYIERIEDDEEL